MRQENRPARLARTVAILAAAALVLAFAGGCDRGTGSGGKSDSTAMTAIATDIQTGLAQRPDVANASVVYQDNPTANGSVSAEITVKAGTPYDPVVEDALRRIWQSNLNPLYSITIAMIDEQNSQPPSTRRVDPDKEMADLDQKFGPHPTK
jgi:hypothetical protein